MINWIEKMKSKRVCMSVTCQMTYTHLVHQNIKRYSVQRSIIL